MSAPLKIINWIFAPKFSMAHYSMYIHVLFWGAPTLGTFSLGPDRAQAQARHAGSGLSFYYITHAGLVFGLSPQSRPRARPPGQARKSPSPQCKAKAQPGPALTGAIRPYFSPICFTFRGLFLRLVFIFLWFQRCACFVSLMTWNKSRRLLWD
jgi:hypothetical protein